VTARTGLLLDPYFSATKLAWLLDHVEGARARAEAGELACGTIDSFLLWRLTGGQVHATDATNASRTLLFDIHAQAWSPELLDLFRIPAALLPEVRDNSGAFGETAVLGPPIAIAGMAGDQHAALIGQTCFAAGEAKATYGTGCFMLLNTGAHAVASQHRLLTTLAYRLDGQPSYALEGSIFAAGAAVKWLRDGLGLITHASDTNDMATRVADNGGVYMVPGFVGLGAPHWDPDARGLIAGLSFASNAAHLARAALESVAYQTFDLADAMTRTAPRPWPRCASTAGWPPMTGSVSSSPICSGVAVERPHMLETTALGAAFLAGWRWASGTGPAGVAALRARSIASNRGRAWIGSLSWPAGTTPWRARSAAER
jgi:glycerol kinase